MASTDIPTTFLELQNDVRDRTRGPASSHTISLDYIKRALNAANHDLHINYNWPWAERDAQLIVRGTYTTGTVALAAGGTAVTGTSTLWNTATGYGFNNARVGGKITFAGAENVYDVTAVGSDTSITIGTAFIGATALSGAAYTYFEDEYALASDFMRPIDLREFSGPWPLRLIPRREFYARFPRNSNTGRPLIATLIELGPSGSAALRPRLLIHPAPDQRYIIPYRYITSNIAVSATGTGAANLSADTDEPTVPLRYRMALVHYAVYTWYRDRKDDQRATTAYQEYQTIVQRGEADMISTNDRVRLLPRPIRRNWTRSRRGRYQTGTEFDQIRDY